MKRFWAHLWGWVAVTWVALAGAAWAEKPVIVVELFTSQGCSSCPPADAFLHELAKRDDVIALSLHVDYWDYLGWKDAYAQQKFTQRQHAYARAGKRRSVYTPQMIIQGQDHVVGNHPMDVTELIKRHQAGGQPVAVSARRQGGTLRVMASAKGRIKTPMVVHVVSYVPTAQTKIRRGENAGRTITYANVAKVWTVAGEWDGRKPLDMSAKVDQGPVAVIVQAGANGPVLGATRVE
ncbi:MAG: DUF1223 domain-containing protein [Rhodobacterales bacterium]|nr:MAG: DUF1223 domain-containing protein [Rhodobacterales bacterium]